ncbi:uncharacterized protein LOC107364242 isoform X1 [Tetranychus urticae]|uniref:uncharacterized protein LOC107364242 isoform X1 n=1 Tax=Tetranychus urticae TaxID=32264 RepID=UPI00077BD8CF|nr:uncharacterized protein LOC107364242 isoform X1 [Tetranychus urticae]
MTYFTTEERTTIIKLYYKHPEDFGKISDLWSKEHRVKPKPSKEIIESFVKCFERTGSVKHEIGVMLDPMTGALEPYKNPDLCPYLIQTMRHLNKPIPEHRLSMANYLLESNKSATLKLDHVWFTGKVQFCLSGYTYRDTYRFWGTSSPEKVIVNPLDDSVISVYAAICGKTLLGPYFIPNNIDALEYSNFLENEILIDIHELEMDTYEYAFMLDVPDDLKGQEIYYTLTGRFGDRILAEKCQQITDYGNDWPNFSPDLNPVDFFLWGYIKDKIDEARPENIDALKNVIVEKFEEIRSKPDILSKNLEILLKRLDFIKKSGGWHFEKMFC